LTDVRGYGKQYKEWLEDTDKGSIKSQLRKIIDEKKLVSKDYGDFINRLHEAGIETTVGSSRKYGRVTKYRFSSDTGENRWHRGYSLGADYTDRKIEERINRSIVKKAARATAAAERRARKTAEKAAMTKGERVLDKQSLKISHMIDTSTDTRTADTHGLDKWKDKQNAMLMQKLNDDLRAEYGIDYTGIKGKLHELEAELNRTNRLIKENNQSLENARRLLEACGIYLQTYKTNDRYEHSTNQECYYQEHSSELHAYDQAVEFLLLAGLELEKLRDGGEKVVDGIQRKIEYKATENKLSVTHSLAISKQIEKLKKIEEELDTYLSVEKMHI